jgi:hypothetical protein
VSFGEVIGCAVAVLQRAARFVVFCAWATSDRSKVELAVERCVADEYLQCHLCRSYDTGAIESVGPPSAVEHSSASFSAERWQRRACLASGLNKDQVTRLMFIECNRCGARRSVTQVKAGFHATTKKDRKAAKGV